MNSFLMNALCDMQQKILLKMVKRRIKLQHRILFTFSLLIIIGIILTLITFAFPPEINREILLKKIKLGLASSSSVCEPPKLPVNSPELMKFIHHVPPIDCKAAGENWVKCKGSICSIQEQAKILFGKIQCQFIDVIRVNDYENYDGKATVTNDSYQLVDSDVVKVKCRAGRKKWSSILTTIRKNNAIWKESNWEKVSEEAMEMNVLMYGIDSVSRNLFMRKLPKTYKYITEQLNGVVLNGYNIVGDGTPQALIPMLTGKTELELPDTRKRFYNTQYVNSYPFVWNEFKENGYVTGYLEDMPSYGVFTYRLNGFKEIPTDHYMRPYYLSDISEQRKWPKYCTGNVPSFKIMSNFVKDFYHFYQSKPKFMFAFHGELSHDDYNLVGAADDNFKDFLTDMHESHLLNNTILFIFADHGHRFAAIRNTLQGKLEERLPFFSVILPSWFQKKHPQLYNNLKSNVEKITTPFDIHATLKSILNLSVNEKTDLDDRSISLFSEVPSDRTCSKAFIEPHWCACLTWHPINVSQPIVSLLSQTLIENLNNFTNSYRSLCDIWLLKKINWVSKLIPNENLVKFKQNADRDGFLADLSADTKIEYETYQINVMLEPDNALFEASITHKPHHNTFHLKMSDISRINMYGNQSKCIEDIHQDLRKYCHCKY